MKPISDLSKAKADLLAKLARIEAVEKLREELATKEKELLSDLGEQSNAPAQVEKTKPAALRHKTTQLQVIAEILTQSPNLNRHQIFAKLMEAGRAPGNVGQMSALLSRGKKEGIFILRDEDNTWSTAETWI